MEYKITIANHDGSREILKTQEPPNHYGLIRALEKCEIKWYKIEIV